MVACERRSGERTHVSLALGSFILIGESLADIYGARRVFAPPREAIQADPGSGPRLAAGLGGRESPAATRVGRPDVTRVRTSVCRFRDRVHSGSDRLGSRQTPRSRSARPSALRSICRRSRPHKAVAPVSIRSPLCRRRQLSAAPARGAACAGSSRSSARRRLRREGPRLPGLRPPPRRGRCGARLRGNRQELPPRARARSSGSPRHDRPVQVATSLIASSSASRCACTVETACASRRSPSDVSRIQVRRRSWSHRSRTRSPACSAREVAPVTV